MTQAVSLNESSPAAEIAVAEPLNRVPWRYRAMVRKTRDLEAALTALDDAKLKKYIDRIRVVLRDSDRGEAELDEQLPKVFAAVCVVARRHLNLRPYNVQLIGGYELHRGRIAEMATGEGKTLVATLPATLNAVSGRGVHVVTVNDYLARRDAENMSPIYKTLGLTVGVLVSGMDDDARRAAYRCDVVYATNKELGFDYLRDQVKLHDAGGRKKIDALALLSRQSKEPVMRQLHFAIVDEADSILVDESRMPLIIAGESGLSPMAWAYEWADNLAQRLRPRHDFEFKPEKRILDWKDEGRTRLAKLLEQTNTPSIAGAKSAGESWQNLVINALRARWAFDKDQHYVINAEGEVVIVDEFTGRRMPGRTWSEGIQQAVQAKERLPVTAPSETLARTTYQHFFGLYDKLAGMTGTAWTERAEFKKVYRLNVVRIPTHRPVRRARQPENIFRTVHEKYLGVAAEILAVRGKLGRPILVGTRSIEESEALADVLRQRGIPFEVLNARPENARRESQIVANAGQLGAVTLATNMAGRGTDIKLGPGVATLGGLHVIGTQRHESRRVDNQLIGRCGRQGDPGSCVFFLSLQDPILAHVADRRKQARIRRKQRIRFGAPITSTTIRSLFRRAQLKVEHLHYRQRQQLMEYEDWLNKVYHQMGGN
jgi:preprotein translocase subunit SecA